jgi:hypothetical protein
LPPVFRELMKLAGKKKREFTPHVLDQGDLRSGRKRMPRVDLTDAMNTAKYEKLESYGLIGRAQETHRRSPARRAARRRREGLLGAPKSAFSAMRC